MKKIIALMILVLSGTMVFGEEIIPWRVENNNNAINTQKNININRNKNKIKINVKNSVQPVDDFVVQKNSYNADIVTVKEAHKGIFSIEKEMKKKMSTTSDGSTPMRRRNINDPYAVKINGQKYYMVKNKPGNNYRINDILGYEDNKSDIFKDLKSLNSDKDTKITGNELKKANIRFVAVQNDKLQLQNKLLDYNLNNILYIDLTSLRNSINNGQIGSFGYFDMYIKENNKTKKIIGFVTFDSDDDLNELIKND